MALILLVSAALGVQGLDPSLEGLQIFSGVVVGPDTGKYPLDGAFWSKVRKFFYVSSTLDSEFIELTPTEGEIVERKLDYRWSRFEMKKNWQISIDLKLNRNEDDKWKSIFQFRYQFAAYEEPGYRVPAVFQLPLRKGQNNWKLDFEKFFFKTGYTYTKVQSYASAALSTMTGTSRSILNL